MRTKAIISALAVIMTLSSCTPYVTKREFAPQMYVEHPRSILVLPPINISTAADAKDYYAATIAEPLTNCGYYVFPIEVVNDVLQQEGLYDTETMMNVPPQKFKEFFGADAVLYVSIEKWNTSYLITSGSVTVKLACELKSTITGNRLWFYNDEVTVNTSGDNAGRGGWVGLLAQAVSTAIKTAATDYVPLARQANGQILMALPLGRYHEKFNLDAADKIEKKSDPEKEKKAH